MPTQEEYEDLIVKLDTKMDSVQSTISQIADHVSKINGSVKQVCTTVYGHDSDKGLCGLVDELGGDQKKHAKIVYTLIGIISAGGGAAFALDKLFG